MTINQPATEIKPTTGLSELVTAVRGVVHAGVGWLQTAQLVAGQLSRHLPGPGLLTAGQRAGDPDRHCTHTLHVEPDGSFSVVALVWRPGQATRIHDHITWCAFAVIDGVEHEEVFDARLRLIGEHTNHPGDVQALTARLARPYRARVRPAVMICTAPNPANRALRGSIRDG